MAKIKTNQCTTLEWETPEEEVAVKTFSELNRLFLISRRGEVSQRKLALVFDPLQPFVYAQQAAFLDGQRDLLNELLGE